MKELQMPSSYAAIPAEEQIQIGGGGELSDAWDRFTDQLRLDDFFFSGGILSLSFTFVPMLLFRVVGSAYRLAENVYVKLSNQFGFHDDTLSALQSYTDEMRQKRQERGVSLEPKKSPRHRPGRFFVYSTRIAPCSRRRRR